MTALYVLAQEYRAAAVHLADLDLDAETVADTLDSLSGDLETKAVNVAMFARNLQVTEDAIGDAIDELKKRKAAIAARRLRVFDYLLGAMIATGKNKISGPYLSLSVRDNPPAVDVFDAAKVPAEFMAPPPPAPPPAPDKTAIKAAIKAGREVPGCRLTQAQRIEIK
jgi:hypothetical protein